VTPPDDRLTILQRANDARRHPPGVSTRVQRIAMRNDAHTLFDAMTPRERGMLIERAIDFRRDLAALDERRA
jgi:hypothetical protein